MMMLRPLVQNFLYMFTGTDADRVVETQVVLD